MAHFRAEIEGQRGDASRLGTKSSGMYGHIAGWDIGAKVYLSYNSELKRNEMDITIEDGNSSRNTIESFRYAVTREGIKQI